MAKETFDKEEVQFFGDVMTAMIGQSQALTNSLDDMRLAEIADWQERYVKLFELVEKTNAKLDSLTLDRILDAHAYHYNSAANALKRNEGESGGIW